MNAAYRRMVLFCMGAVLAALVTGMPTVQAFTLISTQEEVRMGRSMAEQLEKDPGLVEDPALQARVAEIGRRLAAVAGRQDITYSFKVLNGKEINAFALPGGFIYIYKGLIDYMPSDDELAGVLGHELGHVVKRHIVHQIEKGMVTNLVFGVVFGDRGAFLQNLAVNAIMAGYSRGDEREADQLGFRHSFQAGYNPYSMLISMKKLSDLEEHPAYGLFSDHPEPDVRVKLLQGYLADAKIHPGVTESGKTATVVDGSWSLPPITAPYDGYKPVYRAYFLAGRLARLTQLPEVDADKFILYNDGQVVKVLYDDDLIVTVTEQDGVDAGVSASDLAGTYLDKLREWAGRQKPAGQPALQPETQAP